MVRTTALALLTLALATLGACAMPAEPAGPGPEEDAAEPQPEADAAEPEPEADAAEPEPEEDAAGFGPPSVLGRFDATEVPGASGLAASARNPGWRYLLDDRPGTDGVWLLDREARLHGPLRIAGLDAVDTESLEVAPCGPDDARSCLYVGDIGDNLRSREHVEIHRIVEPDLDAPAPTEPLPAETARLAYPDGPHDAEALLVDPDGRPFLVTKAPFDAERGETGPTRLYAAPAFSDGVLEEAGEIVLPAPQRRVLGLVVGEVVTGGSVAADGRALLRTYDHVVLLTPPEPAADLATLPAWEAGEVPGPLLPQGEAVAWDADGCGYALVSERVGGLWHVPCVTG
ncbi:MAG: hypothetical protein ACQETV_07835 [Actinomycetota bacterium]